jgi:tetratricopeptide (TPR) repeat protein
METFENAFRRARTENTKKRTFANLLGGISSNYLTFYQSAINAYNNQNLNSALENINKTIEKSDINDWKHLAFRANVLEDLGKLQDAMSDYEKAIEFSGNDINVYALYHQIGFCYLNLGNNTKAVEFYSYAIELKHRHPNTASNQDSEGMDMGVMLGIPFKRIYNNRANAYLNLGQLDESLEDCKKSISYDKNYSNPYLVLANVYSKAGQEAKAIEYLKISAQLGNRNAQSTLREIGL